MSQTEPVSPVPAGFNTITPYLVVENAVEAIAVYQKVFGAEVVRMVQLPDGKVMNAQLRIGNSMLMLNDEWPEFGAVGPKKIGGTAVTIHLYVEDTDAYWERALAAGFTVGMPLGNQPWGDRYGSLYDPYGHCWSVAMQVEQVSTEEFLRRAAAMAAECGPSGEGANGE